MADETGLIEVSEVAIKDLIYVVRGKQVMLDSDLAKLYQVETKYLNKAVKRNISRFPEPFCIQLTEEECDSLRFQIGTSKGGRRYLPYVFTEQGIAMLSAVLRSDVAIKVSIRIMNAFVEMRKIFASNALMFERINEIEVKHLEYQKQAEEKFNVIFDYISEHEETPQKIFFNGQIYDAFSFLIGLVEKAQEKLVLIDNYVDIDTLNILAKKKMNVNVCIYTVKKTKLTDKDVDNFNKQYPTLEVKYTNVFHDRFLILDDTYAYHIGASLKDAGKKCFGVSLIEDGKIIADIMKHLEMKEVEVK